MKIVAFKQRNCETLSSFIETLEFPERLGVLSPKISIMSFEISMRGNATDTRYFWSWQWITRLITDQKVLYLQLLTLISFHAFQVMLGLQNFGHV